MDDESKEIESLLIIIMDVKGQMDCLVFICRLSVFQFLVWIAVSLMQKKSKYNFARVLCAKRG